VNPNVKENQKLICLGTTMVDIKVNPYVIFTIWNFGEIIAFYRVQKREIVEF